MVGYELGGREGEGNEKWVARVKKRRTQNELCESRLLTSLPGIIEQMIAGAV